MAICRHEKYDSDSIEQMTWDNLLIKGWFSDAPTRALVGKFFSAFPGADLVRLRRIPQHKWEMASGCRRFVAAYLPMLSTALWDGLSQQDALFKLMSSRLDILKQPSDKRKAQSEARERFQDKKASASVALAKSGFKDQWNTFTRAGQWNTCK